jgi:lipopolysaccharide export system protein LptA
MRAPLRLCAAILLAARAAAGAGAAPEVEATGTAVERLGLVMDSRAPLEIRADELEALPDPSGRDRVIFQQNVRVSQGDMLLHCNWLEAIYPKRPQGSDTPVGGQPERITARGAVRIIQAGNEAQCSEAVFDNQACSAECTASDGRATLRRGDDTIEADRIFFDLCKGVLKARGNVRIQAKPAEGAKP